MYIKSAIAIVILMFFAVIIGLTSFTYVQYAPHLSSTEKILNYKDTGIVLTDRNNVPFYSINDGEVDERIPLRQISDHLEEAIISVEDEKFYSHRGISVEGILRSIILNIEAQSLSYGGSTLTQQLVKNTILSPEKSFARKYQEAVLSIHLENNYSKEEILEMYLNSVYYGEGAIGINDASKTYFNKQAKDLNLSESAFLAGILKSPGLLSPYTTDSGSAQSIKDSVLEKMREDEVITQAEFNEASSRNVVFADKSINDDSAAPHFALMVEERLKEQYGEDVIYDGLTVKTTIDLFWQEMTQRHVSESLSQRFGNGEENGAAVIMNPTSGEVLALVGSRDWFNEQYGKYNMATAPRQPGSSFKPIVYSLALENNTITPATVLEDERKTFENDYRPENYDRRYRGRVSVRRALANSLNIPSVEIMEQVGVRSVVSKADDFGISTINEPSNYGPSLVLGTGEVSVLEMVNAYSGFANNGVRYDPTIILEIKDKYGDVIYENSPRSEKVIEEETAYLITSILSDDSARRETFGNTLSLPFPAAVKTGTSENFRDAWTIGYTRDFVVGVWVGHNDSTPMYNAPGSSAAAPVWKNIMMGLNASNQVEEFIQPEGIVSARFCIPGSSESARMEYFKEGTEPERDCESVDTRTVADGRPDTSTESAPQPPDVDMPNVGGVESPDILQTAEGDEEDDNNDEGENDSD